MGKCQFCGNEAEKISFDYANIYYVKCPQCGKYALTFELETNLSTELENKNKISHLLLENKLRKKAPILLSETKISYDQFNCYTKDEFLKTYPQEASEYIDRILLNLSQVIKYPYETIIESQENIPLFFVKDMNSVRYFIKQLSSMDYISYLDSKGGSIIITANGWKRISDLKTKSPGDIKQVFVAMWFDPAMNPIFEDGIKPAIEAINGYKALRIDNVDHNNKIDDEIIAEIKKSRFMVADFTGNRGGVYFEAGFAKGLGIPVIWIVNKSDIDNLHFDTRQYNHIDYSSADDLKKRLKARIETTI